MYSGGTLPSKTIDNRFGRGKVDLSTDSAEDDKN